MQPRPRPFKKGLAQHFQLNIDEGFNVSLVQNREIMRHQKVAARLNLHSEMGSPLLSTL